MRVHRFVISVMYDKVHLIKFDPKLAHLLSTELLLPFKGVCFSFIEDHAVICKSRAVEESPNFLVQLE